VDEAEYERDVARLRECADTDAVVAAWAAGLVLDPTQAVSEAMADAGDSLGTGVPPPPKPATAAPLSTREQEVAGLIAQGWTNRRIAAELGLAERTVDTHVGKILSKLGVQSRDEVRAHVAR
jgi:DNA-binding NarL/FixJ family response regulator